MQGSTSIVFGFKQRNQQAKFHKCGCIPVMKHLFFNKVYFLRLCYYLRYGDDPNLSLFACYCLHTKETYTILSIRRPNNPEEKRECVYVKVIIRILV